MRLLKRADLCRMSSAASLRDRGKNHLPHSRVWLLLLPHASVPRLLS